ncbi:SGNH/GDSL hydrolase family protein [Saccharothrix violaceirubra]|uniref:Lysophospholipase L1-like esterase n=1 Tax=Saccharothrix violaceirubra TaxID=413306 RepID=A0A7W7T609_9PSEU|nr:SGNH/GDSL hydrolase family protein [Saccharothrix violaceirubra]MBB4967223.1 lysophospholipase L1-like esterase [Saccharothrix violaceirubra]
MRKSVLSVLVAAALLGASATATAQPAAHAAGGWGATWGSSQHAGAELFGSPWVTEGFDDHSVRQVVRLSRGGPALRVRLSNAFGTSPLRLTGATVARTDKGASVRPGSVRHVTFQGRKSTTVAVGAELASDPIPFAVPSFEQVTVTLHFAGRTGPATAHGDATATSWRAKGDHRADVSASAFTESTTSWYYLSGVDVVDLSPRRDTVVAFGDSITDGAESTVDADRRYPDRLARRLGGRLGVVNAGISGNRVVNDSPCMGEKAPARFTRDVLSHPDVRTVILLEGINDIGFSEIDLGPCGLPNPRVTADEIIGGYRQIIAAAKAKGIRVVGGTLTPFKGAFYATDRGEGVRQAVNHWIRTSGAYDAVVDFDKAVADPADPTALRPEFDPGDHLHPNDAGYQAMADAVDLSTL